MSKLSLKQQNYIETIHELCEKHEHAHTKAIAEKLNIKMASVTEAMVKLSNSKMVNYSPRLPVTLTKKGKEIAEQLNFRHEVLARFFTLIGCENKEAEETACQVEHSINDNITKLIDSLNKTL